MSHHSFLITGGSSGLGLSLALTALRAGHRVVATARDPSRARLANPTLERLGGVWLALDVTRADTEGVVGKVVADHGVDVLVNSAGYALMGAVEDTSDAEIHAQMDTNFYGCLRTIKGVLPAFRERKGGTIVNVSSGAGLVGMPARGLYAASKFALEGVSESLSAELAPFNIRVIVADLGAFRTNFLNTIVLPEKGLSEQYKDGPVDAIMKLTQNMASMKLGNTDKAAQRILEVVTETGMGESEDVKGCLRVVLGADCMKLARDKLVSFGRNLDVMEDIAMSTGQEE